MSENVHKKSVSECATLAAALQNNDLTAALRLMPSFADEDRCKTFSSADELTQVWKDAGYPINLVKQVAILFTKWQLELKPGTNIDVWESKNWYECRILSEKDDSIDLHYIGWHSKYDCTLPRRSYAIAPLNFRTTPNRRYVAKRSSTPLSKVHKTVDEKRSSNSEKSAVVLKDNFALQDKNSSQSNSDMFCTICNKQRSPGGSEVTKCDGFCLRAFHLSCLHAETKADRDDPWYCDGCVRGEYACALCLDVGEFEEPNGVFKCQLDQCGAFYHIKCIEKLAGRNFGPRGLFECPHHNIEPFAKKY